MSTPRDRIEAGLGLSGPPLRRLRDAPPHIPDHELVRRIGQGAYGEVWLARSALGTLRAVKILFRDNFKDDRPYEREFAGIRRFEPLSRSNEGFVDILQVGRDDAGGWFYYVMELADDAAGGASSERSRQAESGCQGNVPTHTASPSNAHASPLSASEPRLRVPDSYRPRTLGFELHRHGRIPLEDCLQLGLTLTLALGHLHRRGLVHRDVKPANIIFVGGVPKLADIGLVTEIAGARTFVGTEGYVPPEGPGSQQADLYALGKVLYEASMGKDRNEFPEPFSRIGTDGESVALMELNAVLLRACAPDPKRRYAKAEDMHSDLALLHSGGSVKRRHQFDRQFALAKRLGAAAAGVALLVGTGWLWQREQTDQMSELARKNAALAMERTRLAEENRNRVVLSDIDNGNRLLDADDPAGALLWFADALTSLAERPAEAAVHRMRIHQTLRQTPRLLRVLPHDSEIESSAFSPDGQFIVTGTKSDGVRLWNVVDGSLVWGPTRVGFLPHVVRFTRDGSRILLSSSPEDGMFNGAYTGSVFFAVLDADSGREFLPADGGWRVPRPLIAVHFSHDDRWLGVADKSGVIHVLGVGDGRVAATLEGHAQEARFLSFNADGSQVASGSPDRSVRIWRLPSGEPVGPPLLHRWPVVKVQQTTDGKHILTASMSRPGGPGFGETAESEIQAWDVESSRKLGQPILGAEWVAIFVPPGTSGTYLVQNANGLALYPFAETNPPLVRFEMGPLNGTHFSRDGRRVAFSDGSSHARVFDAQSGAHVTGLLRHGHWGVTDVEFSPDEQTLLTSCTDGTARLWDMRPQADGAERRTLPSPIRLQYTQSGRRQLGRAPGGTPVPLNDGTIGIYDDRLQERYRFKPGTHGNRMLGAVRAQTADLWAVGEYGPSSNSTDTVCFVWNPGRNAREVRIQDPAERINSRLGADGLRYITAGLDNVVRCWRTEDGTLESELEIHGLEGEPKGLVGSISPDARTALWFVPPEDSAAAPGVNTFRFLDLESGRFVGNTIRFPPRLFDSEFSPDGSRVAFLESDGKVTIVESRTGRIVSNRIAHSSNLEWVHWSPDGRRLLTSGLEDEVLVWDPETGSRVFGALRHSGTPSRLARWSSDGRFIVTRTDRKVRVWDGSTGEAITPLLDSGGVINFALMTHSGRVLATVLPDQLVAWDLPECTLDSAVLEAYAEFLSGRRIGETGALLILPPEELAARERSLRIRAPRLFE